MMLFKRSPISIVEGQLSPQFQLSVAEWLALTVIGMAGATAKHLSLRPCLLTIGLILLVQRGDDVDLATLSTQDAASPRQKGPGRLVLLIGAESQ